MLELHLGQVSAVAYGDLIVLVLHDGYAKIYMSQLTGLREALGGLRQPPMNWGGVAESPARGVSEHTESRGSKGGWRV